jgi:hypothetical protein
MGRMTMTSTKTTWAPADDCRAIDNQLPLAEWWNQDVYILGKIRATRKSLVLAAANNDGGAHVDVSLTAEYETLMSTGQRGWFHYSPNNDHIFQPIMDAHLVYIRQMGFELLNSPELLSFAKA